tara:strand:- start:37 stop:504 length:468 start_codon:yes stop_codon:yes gene_type:complete
MNKTKEVWCYVYGLLDDDGLVTYCGRSYHPRFRGRSHSHKGNIKILDKFIDIEHKWVQKLKNKGQAQDNKELPLHGEDWDVGDIFSTYIPIKDMKKTGGGQRSITKYDLKGNKLEVFESLISAVRSMGITNTASIGHCARGRQNTAYGFIWKYTG